MSRTGSGLGAAVVALQTLDILLEILQNLQQLLLIHFVVVGHKKSILAIEMERV